MTFWTVFSKTAVDMWEDLLHLMLFNLICFVGGVLIVPLPFLLFGLFGVAYEIGQGNAIKLNHFFGTIRRTWRLAAVWGVINLVIWGIIAYSLFILVQIDSQVAIFLRVSIVGLALIWAVLQPLMLAVYPRLVKPSFKMALQNGGAVIGLAPIRVLFWFVWVSLFLLAAVVVTPIMFFLGLAVVAIFTNRFVEIIIKQHLKAQA